MGARLPDGATCTPGTLDKHTDKAVAHADTTVLMTSAISVTSSGPTS
jgi:hypothetical protein